MKKKLLIGLLLIAISVSITRVHTETSSGLEWFQTGNMLPISELQSRPSKDLEDNRIGGVWHGFWAVGMQDIVNNEILSIGLKRVRLAINGFSWNVINWEKPELVIDPDDDDVITSIAENDITMTYVLNFWDKAWCAEGNTLPCPRFKNEGEIQRYLEFVRFIVRHFKDRVEYYEIWNEPDMGWDETNIEPCIQAIDVDDYINLVRRVVPVIREEYPEAKIVVGSTMPQVEPGSRDYLLGILRSDVMPLVDVIAWHPGGPAPDHEFWRDYYYNYTSLVQEIMDVASDHGFTGEYTADEMVWWTQEDFPYYEPWTYTNVAAAKYYARMIITHLGMDVTVKPGGISQNRRLSFSTIQNLCTLFAGSQPTSLPVTIQGAAADIHSYAFSLSNGDELFALWTDGPAMDSCQGSEANLTIQSLSKQHVMGIDVLEGVQQPLLTEMTDGSLTLNNIILRDYPLILRIYDKRSSSLTSSISKHEVNEGEGITVSGSLTPHLPDLAVTITYQDPNGRGYNRTVTTDSNGNYTHTYVPDSCGTWSLTASWSGDSEYEGVTTSSQVFTVNKVEAEPEPEQPKGIPGFSTVSVIIGSSAGVILLWIQRKRTMSQKK